MLRPAPWSRLLAACAVTLAQAAQFGILANSATRASAQPPAAPPPAAAPQLTPIETGQIIARVGGEVVLAADVLPRVNEMLEKYKDKMQPDEMELARQELMKRELGQLLETKLLLVDALRKIPKENVGGLETKVNAQFDEVEVPRLMKETKSESPKDLEAKLSQYGSSLGQQRRMFFERMVGSQWLRQQINLEPTVHHDDLLAWYRDHQQDFEFEARARWEEIMVRFDRHPDKAAAWRAAATLGNQVLQGAKFADVARAGSDGVNADRGGQYDWTSRGSLVSQTINRAIFTLPVGQLSQIVESERGFHILRVLERHDAGKKPFDEAQVEIRSQIQKSRRNEQVKAFVEKLKRDTPVWTIFDAEPKGVARQPTGTAQR